MKSITTYLIITYLIPILYYDLSGQILQTKNVSKILKYYELFKNWFGRTYLVSRKIGRLVAWLQQNSLFYTQPFYTMQHLLKAYRECGFFFTYNLNCSSVAKASSSNCTIDG